MNTTQSQGAVVPILSKFCSGRILPPVPAACLLLAAVGSISAYAGPDVPVDPASSIVQNEISLAVVPGSLKGPPVVLLAAYNDNPYPGGFGLGVSYSTNAGASWTSIQLPFPTNSLAGVKSTWAFDPTATADTQGNLFVGHISSFSSVGSASGLYVHKSANNGVSWQIPVEVSVDGAATNNPDPNYRFNDRCQIVADTFSASPRKDNIYAAWIKDRGLNQPSPWSDIYFSYSTDSGASFSTPIQINNTNFSNMANMPIPAVAPDGTVYVSWLDYDVTVGGTGTIYLDSSTDGGATWVSNRLVAAINLPPLNVTTAFLVSDALAKGAPVLAVSPSDPNDLYLMYAYNNPANPLDEADIYFMSSTNGGYAWSTAIQVNDDPSNNDQILPWMAVMRNGTIVAAWYDRRNDASDANWDVYTTTSTDGGVTFSPNQPVNDPGTAAPTPVGGTWMGEYLGLTVDSRYAYFMWTSAWLDTAGDLYFDTSDITGPPVIGTAIFGK